MHGLTSSSLESREEVRLSQVKRQVGFRWDPANPTWDPTSHPGSKMGSRLPPEILGGTPPLTWDPRRDPASPAQGPTWDPAFHPGSKANAASHLQSKAGSHLSHLGSIPGFHIPPGIQGVYPASHQGSKGGIRNKSVQQS